MAQKNPRFFCDTTIVYYKLHGHTLQKQAVVDSGKQGRLVISRFVFGEYIRGYIQGLIELYFHIDFEESVEDGILSFTAEAGNRPRKLGNAFASSTVWLTEMADWRDKEKTLRRLGNFIRDCLFNLNHEFPTKVADPLKCEIGPLDFETTAYTNDSIPEFYDELVEILYNPDCKQCQFRRNTEQFVALNNIDLYSDKQKEKYKSYKGYLTQAEWLDKSTRTTLTSPSCFYCNRIGDSIIALAAPNGTTILSGDAQSFPPLCDILKKPIKLIPSVQQLQDELGRGKPRHKRSRKKPGK